MNILSASLLSQAKYSLYELKCIDIRAYIFARRQPPPPSRHTQRDGVEGGMITGLEQYYLKNWTLD